MITVKDVAKKSGFSICTVSRVLDGKGYIKDSTREKVLDAVRELGYVRNTGAAELKTGTSSLIAILLPDIENMFYANLASEVEKYASSKGYLVVICNTSYDKDKEDYYLRMMKARNISGVIAVPVTNDVSSYKQLLAGIPLIVFNRILHDSSLVSYRIDNYQAAREVVSHLITVGRKKIGAVFLSFCSGIYQERYQGLKDEIESAGLVFNEEYVIKDAGTINLEGELTKLFSREDHPDAVFAGNDMLAFEVYKTLNGLGLSIPGEVAVAGFDNTHMSDRVYPPLTTYDIDISEFAKRAIDGIISHEVGTGTNLLTGQLIIRESTSND